jgi:hypothetical protein
MFDFISGVIDYAARTFLIGFGIIVGLLAAMYAALLLFR